LCTKGSYELQYQRIHSRYVIFSFLILILTKFCISHIFVVGA